MLPSRVRADGAAEDAVRVALEKWTKDFNAGRVDAVCSLFARDLRYDFRDAPERGYEAMCDNLQRALHDQKRKFAYALEIKEILVMGDIAIVRLIWTVTVSRPNQPDRVTREQGLDVFRQQKSGRWKIIRFIAYEMP
jgi:ketosteroid isomerase-like protein